MQFRAYIFLALGIILTSGLFVFSGKFVNIFQDKNLALLAEIPLNTSSSSSTIQDTAQPKTIKKASVKKSEKKQVISKTLENILPAQIIPQDKNSPSIPSTNTQPQISITNQKITPTENLIVPNIISASIEESSSSTNISNPPASSPISNINHVLISEIQLTGGSGKTTNDFIELWNPTNSDIDISNWKLRKRTQSGTESSMGVFADATIIKSHGFFLWANSKDGFSSSIGADLEYSSYSMADNNSLALEDKDGNIIDSVAWGSDLVNPFGETSPIAITLEANQSFERKAWADTGCVSSFGIYDLKGNGCDTENNLQDFELRSVSSPQNSKSAIEQ